MKLLISLLVAVVCLSALTEGGMLPGRKHDEQFMALYMMRKAAESCYGKEFARAMELEFRNTFGKCFAVALAKNEEEMTGTKQKRSAPSSPESNSIFETTSQEQREPNKIPFYNAWIIRALKNDVFSNVRIVSCLFDVLNLTITANGTVDASSMIEKFASNPNIPEDVKKFAVKGLYSCEAKSNEGDFMIWGQKYADFHKLLKFFRCSEAEKWFACIKADFKKDAAMYDMAGLDGELSDVTEIAKIYFVYSSYANWDRTGLWDM